MASRLVVEAFRRLPPSARMFLVRRATPKYTLGVQVIVRRPDGRILLVRQPYRDRLFLPGGTLRRGERVLEGAARELREEVGLHVLPVDLGHVQVRPATSWVTFYTLAEIPDATAETLVPTSPEIDAVQWVRPDDLPEVDPAVPAALAHAQTPTASLGGPGGPAISSPYQPGPVARTGRDRSR